MEDNRADNPKKHISAFDHDYAMMHCSQANRRMLIALLAVCLTFIITISVFVAGYTVREKNWLDTLMRLQGTSVSEVDYATAKDTAP